MSVMINMLKHRDNLSVAEQSVLDYLIENKSTLKEFTVEGIAKAAYTSPASVVRMCKKLGYDGFKDFKVDFILANSKIEIPDVKEYTDVILSKDVKEFNGKIAIENNVRALEDTLRLFSEEKLKEAAKTIMSARKILLFGKGSSYLVAKDLQMKLRRIDKFCIAQEDSHDQLTDATFIDHRDVVILVSNSGTTSEIVRAAIVAKENKATIIGVVKAGKSLLADISDIVLYTSALEGDFRSAAMTSRISQMAIIDAIFTECAYYNIEKTVRKLEQTFQTFQKFKSKTQSLT
ncbi:MAG TPA: MurR/RpiR family transcriptional regulator [Acholeplasmataceae bacterium]|nr:MurR/RpiR family transcriptional regulator [Acholeplasmataceae bacterium]